jgi:hypothetical protein
LIRPGGMDRSQVSLSFENKEELMVVSISKPSRAGPKTPRCCRTSSYTSSGKVYIFVTLHNSDKLLNEPVPVARPMDKGTPATHHSVAPRSLSPTLQTARFDYSGTVAPHGMVLGQRNKAHLNGFGLREAVSD